MITLAWLTTHKHKKNQPVIVDLKSVVTGFLLGQMVSLPSVPKSLIPLI